MKITIFAKKRTTEQGKTFYNYLSTLTRKDGTTQTVQVKFRDEAGQPKPEKCPMNITFDKAAANIAAEEYDTQNGERKISYKLWISEWKEGDKYIDHSLDDFE